MATLQEVYNLLDQTPGLTSYITLQTVFNFVAIVPKLKEAIIHLQDATWVPEDVPTVLPDVVCAFIGGKMGVPLDVVDGMWDGLKVFIWEYSTLGGKASNEINENEFDEFDIKYQLCRYSFSRAPLQSNTIAFSASRMLYPPHRSCCNPLCSSPKLLRHKDGIRKVVLYTLSSGVQDAYSGHLYCYGRCLFTVYSIIILFLTVLLH